MKVVSFFSGAGGLDLGFKKSGFDVIWANEFDKHIWETYEKNHPDTVLDKRSITAIDPSEVPDCDGIIGGPPCQSWSVAGEGRGEKDKRGQLFFDFIGMIKKKQPKFFIAENVPGILAPKHYDAYVNIREMLKGCGYDLFVSKLNASFHGVPQSRHRVIWVGFRKDLGANYTFPPIDHTLPTLYDSIYDMPDTLPNNDIGEGGFSSQFMSRNRVRGWNEPSFTILASGRHAPIHPSAPPMVKVSRDVFEFAKGFEHKYRRLSVRECARIQTFPDDFVFYYKNPQHGYKMVGNAVPVKLAQAIADSVKRCICD